MEELLKFELFKLKAGDIYVEIEANESTLLLAHRISKEIKIYGVGDKDPCIGGALFLEGNSQDISDIWFRETEGNLISLLLINKNCKKNLELWGGYVKKHGTIILNEGNTFSKINK